MSEPAKIYVVVGMKGEYSDRDEWCVCAFHDEAEAQAFVIECEQKARDAAVEARRIDEQVGLEASREAIKSLRAALPDPSFDPSGWHAEDVSYTYATIPIGRPAPPKESER